MNTIQPSIINNNNSITKQDIINCLTEFQKWRRGIEPYNYGPNHKDFPYTEKYVGIVIDTVIEMLQKDIGGKMYHRDY